MARSRTGFALAGVLGLALAGSLGMRMAPAGVATAADHCSGPSVTKQAFGKAFDLYANKDLQVFRYTLANCNKMQVQIITYGATIQSIWVPDRAGHMADVVLGFKTLKEYVNEASPDPRVATGGPYFGETIGRYGNRIANAKFSLEGHTYTLPANNGVNSLHGGFVGFGNHVWSATAVHPTGKAGVQMKLVSPNGDDGKNVKCSCTGYPGTLTVFTTFTLDNHNNLGIQYKATVAGKATVLNLTNHSYFNLAGEGSGVAYNQRVMINADRYTPVNTGLIPFGNLAPVKGTPFDFTHAKSIGQDIFDNNPQLLRAQGFDHNWVLNANHGKGLNLAARASDPASGRTLTVWTSEPGVQFYTGNFLNGTLVGISGHIYRQTAGYTFETQHFPDSPNHANFPSTELKPGQTFNSSTVFSFSH